jgi:acetyl-CoA carboxylase biotin carboxyl carrier protein
VEIKQIKELMIAMARCDTTHLRLKKKDFELELQRASEPAEHQYHAEPEEDRAVSMRLAQRKNQISLPRGKDMAAAIQAEEAPKGEEAAGTYITSPMVGTFYSAPSPDDPSFVKVGDLVEKGAVVCIIEAMKVMNEIKAQVSGTIAEICVESSHPVEFGTKLFRIQ